MLWNIFTRFLIQSDNIKHSFSWIIYKMIIFHKHRTQTKIVRQALHICHDYHTYHTGLRQIRVHIFLFLYQNVVSTSDFIWPFLRPYMGVIPNPKMAFIFPISCILALIFPILIQYFPKCVGKGSFPKSQIKSLSTQKNHLNEMVLLSTQNILMGKKNNNNLRSNILLNWTYHMTYKTLISP